MTAFFVFLCVAVTVGVPGGILILHQRNERIRGRWRIVSVKATGTKDQRNIMVKALVHGEKRLFIGRVMDWHLVTDTGLEAAPTWIAAKLFDVWHDFHEGMGVQLEQDDERVSSA